MYDHRNNVTKLLWQRHAWHMHIIMHLTNLLSKQDIYVYGTQGWFTRLCHTSIPGYQVTQACMHAHTHIHVCTHTFAQYSTYICIYHTTRCGWLTYARSSWRGPAHSVSSPQISNRCMASMSYANKALPPPIQHYTHSYNEPDHNKQLTQNIFK